MFDYPERDPPAIPVVAPLPGNNDDTDMLWEDFDPFGHGGGLE